MSAVGHNDPVLFVGSLTVHLFPSHYLSPLERTPTGAAERPNDATAEPA
jgi:hypothetical protein